MTTITISATITSSVIKGGGPQPPVNTIAPVVSGSTSIGSVLSCTTGTWTGTPPITYTYQWARGMSNIPGATSPTYTLVEADAGNNILCQVTATNIAGSSSVSSNALAIPLLLDSYPNAAVAYSVRKLRTAYSGSALRVRRSSDNAESDIGFVANELDTASLLSFVGANDGFVTTWYDQSLNNKNATQTVAANQPQIVSSGSLILQNNKPTLYWTNGLNQRLSNTALSLTQPLSILSVSKLLSSSGINASAIYGSNVNNNLYHSGTSVNPNNTLFGGIGGGGIIIPSTTNIILANIIANTTTLTNRINNVTINTTTSTPITVTNIIIGNNNSNYDYSGSIMEIIIYPTYQLTNSYNIETNINSYYTIYSSSPTWDGSQLSILDSNPNAAVAYSVRALNSAYTGPLIRVRRSSDNAEIDIYALYNGELDTTFLLNFVGAGNGFVTRWYDQSGNGRNLTQGTALNQPRIVNAGILDTQNGKPTIKYDGSNDTLQRSNPNIFNNVNYGVVFLAYKWNLIPTVERYLFYCTTNSVTNFRLNTAVKSNLKYSVGARRLDAGTFQSLDSVTNVNNTSMVVTTNIVDWGNSDAYLYLNNILDNSNLSFLDGGNTSATIPNSIGVGQYIYGGSPDANISEVIAYESSQNISAINTNINSYFNIYP